MSASEVSNNNGDTCPCLTLRHWRDIQNRASHCVGTVTTEKWHFHEFFGTSLLVVEKIWELLKRDSLFPEGCRPKYLLWALHFMKVYPKQSPGCSAVGASAGAVNPKTHRKWVWAFIDAIANLVNVVVSKITCGNQCKSDIVQKMRWVNLGHKAPPSTATTVPAAAHRYSLSTNPHLSVYADVFF